MGEDHRGLDPPPGRPGPSDTGCLDKDRNLLRAPVPRERSALFGPGRDALFPGAELRFTPRAHLGRSHENPLVSPFPAPYTGRRRRGRVVEGTPLLRVQTGNRLEGSNPFVSAI